MIYGYIRVSAKDQNPDRQIYAMNKIGIFNKNQLYIDFVSGKNFERPKYNQLLKRLKADDILVIKSIDRLGRNYSEILEQWRLLTKDLNVSIRVIDMPLLNTSSDIEGLTGRFISDIVLQILAYVAETERNFIKQRQAEGIALAKARGTHFGCKRIELENETEVIGMWKNGEIKATEAAKLLKISKATFYRRCREVIKEK